MALLLCHGLMNGEAPSEREARIQVCSQVICSYLTEIHRQNKSTAGETVSNNESNNRSKNSILFYIFNISFQITGSGLWRSQRSASVAPPHRVSDCLRHGNSSDARAVRAVCLLMGGAAATSALGYLNSCSPSSPLATRAPEIAHGTGGFSDHAAGSFHACSQDVDSPHFNSFDFEGDSDFDAFDCGGFAF